MGLKFFVILFFIANISFAQNDNSGIVFGEKHVYSLTAPKGWILDNKAGVDQGLQAVFYPEGSSWAEGTTVMYANFAIYADGQNTVDELINYDTTEFKKQSPDLKITRQQNIEVKNDIAAKVYSFTNDKNNNTESVAYIPAPTGTVLIIITSRDKDEYKEFYPKFEELVRSYNWLSSDIKVREKE